MRANRSLWDEYRVTWAAFSRSLDSLQQSCAETAGKEKVEEALLAVERAKAAHSDARDRLASALSDDIAAADAAGERAEEDRIRHKAHLLWELSGKPRGTAETDWLHAERLVRSTR